MKMRRKRTSVHLRFLLFFSQVHSVSLRIRRRGRAGGRGQDGVVERRGASRARGVGEFDGVQLAGLNRRGENRRVERPIGRARDGGTDVARGETRDRRLHRATRAARATPRGPIGAREGHSTPQLSPNDRRAGGRETVVAAGGKNDRAGARARSEHALLFAAAERHVCERYGVRSPTAGRVRRLVARATAEPRLTPRPERTMTKREDHFQKPHRDIFRMCHQS